MRSVESVSSGQQTSQAFDLRHRRRRRAWSLLVAGVVLLLIGWCGWFVLTLDKRVKAAHTLASHTYAVDDSEQLTEAMALQVLPDMLRRAGLEPDDWQPLSDDRAVAPNGTPETFLLRNTIDPNDGQIHLFRRPDSDGPGPRTPITLRVELKYGRLDAWVWLNK